MCNLIKSEGVELQLIMIRMTSHLIYFVPIEKFRNVSGHLIQFDCMLQFICLIIFRHRVKARRLNFIPCSRIFPSLFHTE